MELRLAFLSAISWILVVILEFHGGSSCIKRIYKNPRPLADHSPKMEAWSFVRRNGENGQGLKSESNSKVSSETSSLRPFQSSMLMSFVKPLVHHLLVKRWTPEMAIKRLDELKISLVKYYAERKLFEQFQFPVITSVSTARDKGIGFPSLEGALLSLAFLTFSVFLIDMIQTLLAKLKTRTVSNVAPIQLGRHLRGRHKNDSSYSDMITTLSSQVLSAIEKPYT